MLDITIKEVAEMAKIRNVPVYIIIDEIVKKENEKKLGNSLEVSEK